MKTTRLVMLTVLGILLVTGCDFFIDEAKSTPEERMEAFLYDANNRNWASMWKHFHPDATDYSSISSITETTFDSHLQLGSLYVSGKTATCRSGTDSNTQFLFTVIEYEPDNYKIRYVEKNSTVIRTVE